MNDVGRHYRSQMPGFSGSDGAHLEQTPFGDLLRALPS